MESFIGNYTNATFKHHSKYGDGPYANMFEEDDFDDESIIAQELDRDGNPYIRPDADLYLENDPPFVESSDEHIGMELTLPYQGESRRGKIVKRKRNENGELVDTVHENPMLDTRVYEVDFGNGGYKEYSTNLIMENLYAQIDEEGNQYSILKGIVAAKSDDTALKMNEGWITMPGNLRRRRVTTKGWKIKVKWEDDS